LCIGAKLNAVTPEGYLQNMNHQQSFSNTLRVIAMMKSNNLSASNSY
jgi:hypothetical protein